MNEFNRRLDIAEKRSININRGTETFKTEKLVKIN